MRYVVPGLIAFGPNKDLPLDVPILFYTYILNHAERNRSSDCITCGCIWWYMFGYLHYI